jgi:hypothetical protein
MSPPAAKLLATMRLTHHASKRVQQRGIPPWFLELLVAHGRPRHDGHGAMVISVDHDTRRKLQALLPRTQYAQAERYFHVYAVLSPDDAIITAAHRAHRRFH